MAIQRICCIIGVAQRVLVLAERIVGWSGLLVGCPLLRVGRPLFVSFGRILFLALGLPLALHIRESPRLVWKDVLAVLRLERRRKQPAL